MEKKNEKIAKKYDDVIFTNKTVNEFKSID
jgi:hypothetical protein